jgi:hypothetical protein
MQTPAPTLYLAAAERISRVHRPALVVAFYVGLAETEKCVNVIVKAPGHTMLAPIDVLGLGVMLINQCLLALQILVEAPIPAGTEKTLITLTLAEMIRGIDKELDKAKAIFPTTQEYEEASAI